MIKAIIIEDEKPAARRLERLLNEMDVNVVTLLHSVKQSIKWFNHNQSPDLIFLDIQLSDGLSFEIFESINCHSPIIFTTAYDSYTLKAFKLNSVDYLLKPIDEDELALAIKKFKEVFKNPQSNNQFFDIEQIKHLLLPEQSYKDRISILVSDKIKIIETEKIAFIYTEDRTVFSTTFDGQTQVMDETLENLYQMLNPKLFFKLNRQHIINIKAIDEIVNYSNNRLRLKTKFYSDLIIVSRERVKDFKLWLND